MPWRQLDALYFGDSPIFYKDYEPLSSIRVTQVTFMILHAFLAITNWTLTLISGPSIYRQIKNCVMMALACNKNLWENFY